MAGLCGLKTLLLWAGIIAWINCQSPEKTSLSDESSSPRTVTEASVMPSVTSLTPPLTSPTPISDPSGQALDSADKSATQPSPAITSGSPTTTSTKQTSDSQSNSSQNQTSPPITTSSTSQATTQAPPPPQSVSPVSPPRTVTNSTLRSETSLSDESSASLTVTEASVPSLIPPLTSPTPISNSSGQALDSADKTANQPSPANTSDSPTTTSTKQTPDSQSKSSQNQTSPPITTSSTSQATTQAPPPPQCDYTVTPIKFGFQIDITSSTDGAYTINIDEEGLTWTQTLYHQHQHSNQSSSLEIPYLKPCTEYKHSVTFIDNNGNQISCNHTGNKTKTIEMSRSDIKEVERCSPGYVCYRSDWNIMSSLSASNNYPAESCMNDSKTLCIELNNDDFCSDLTVNFASGNCPSFSLTKSISLDFLNPNKITPTVQDELPVDIKVDLPPNCNVTVDYTCVESGNPNKYKTPSELEPFTDYRCVGHIKDNVTVINIPAFNVTIDCDVTITSVTKRVTNTSADLSWTTKSINCPHLSELEKFSYSCSCSPTGHKGDGGRVVKQGEECQIFGLTPYTSYTCRVQPNYNRNNVETPSEIQLLTSPGIPEKTYKVTLIVLDNNVIKVTCHHVKSFYGPKEEYIARLHYDSDPENEIQEKKGGKCDFEFRDLSYFTAYKVKVTTYNGELESEPVTGGVSTQYNSKALIGVMAFILISIIIILAVCLMCRKSRSDVTEDVMLETATYMNVPTRG